MFQNEYYGGPSLSDIAAVTRGNNGYNGFGGFGNGGDCWWFLILLFLLGNNGFNGFVGNGYNNCSSDIQRGFDQQSVMNAITNLSTIASNGFAEAEVSPCNQPTNLLQTMNANQMANMGSFYSLNNAIQDVKYTTAIENCQDRAALAEGNQAILNSINSGVQRLLDDNCQRDIRAKDEIIAQLRTQLNMAALNASQLDQNQKLFNGFAQILNNSNNGCCNTCNSCCA